MKYYSWFSFLGLFIASFLLEQCSPANKRISETANAQTSYYSIDDFAVVEKYDTHVHLNVYDSTFINRAKADNFRLLTVNVSPAYYPPIVEQRSIAMRLVKDYPNQLAYATTFSLDNWNSEEWQQKSLDYLKESFDKGAIAVKVWKNVGMELKDKSGKFVMIDNPKFDTLFNYMVEMHIPLIGHLGEPKNSWLPLEKMTIKSNQNYFSKHPEYHMYLHPEYPSYEDQIQARDHMLEKHQDLKFIGAHLGSLEWSVDELAKRLDKFPNMAVDMAARISHLQYQAKINWQKVHNFCIKYQDRLLYATDILVNGTEIPSAIKKQAHETWLNDWRFFTTDEKMQASEVEGDFKGLKLPRAVIDKIYRENAEKWFPGVIRK